MSAAAIHDLERLAQLVEFSESRAYRSLVQGAPETLLQTHGLRALPVGSGLALVAGSVAGSLNLNRVIGLGVGEPATESMIDDILEMYHSEGLSCGIEIGPAARPTLIVDWLRKRRLRRGLPTAMHYRRGEPVSSTSKGITVVQVRGRERVTVADICCSIFRMPKLVGTLIAHTAEGAGWRQWLAYVEDQPIAAALSFVAEDVAWLGWDATVPEFRGLGAQLALIAHRVNDAAASGCKYVTTETAVNTAVRNDPSFQNYARLGFSFAYERVTYMAINRAQRPNARPAS
jgi:hypothetical protein